MKYFAMYAVVGLLVLSAPRMALAQPDCSAASNQRTLDECADISFRKADKRLNELYAQIKGRLKENPDTAKLLVQAQRSWVKFRDAQCSFETSNAVGGSIYPMLVVQCRDGMTQSRVKTFEGLLKCEEGDLSCPVPAGT